MRARMREEQAQKKWLDCGRSGLAWWRLGQIGCQTNRRDGARFAVEMSSIAAVGAYPSPQSCVATTSAVKSFDSPTRRSAERPSTRGRAGPAAGCLASYSSPEKPCLTRA